MPVVLPVICRSRALTLVELLVSVVIVGFLAALLFGATMKVRSRGHDATCLVQLRDHVRAAIEWSQDNNGLFPSNDLRTELRPYLGILRLQDRVDTAMTCPAAQRLLPTKHYMHVTYGMNQFLMSSSEGVVHSWMKVRYFRNVREPSRVIFFLDGPTDGPNSEGLVYYSATVRPGKNAFFFPHRNGLNLSFVDGHVTWVGSQEFLSPEYQDTTEPGNRWGVPRP